MKHLAAISLLGSSAIEPSPPNLILSMGISVRGDVATTNMTYRHFREMVAASASFARACLSPPSKRPNK